MELNIVFGTGNTAEKLLRFEEKLNIGFFIDNSITKQGNIFHGKKVKSPDEILTTEFEYLIIASEQYYEEINRQCVEQLKIAIEKIIIFHDNDYDKSIVTTVDINKIVPYTEIIIPWKKARINIEVPLHGETYKAKERRIREGFFDRYCNGEGLDIGFGNDLVLPDCYGWEFCNGNAQYLREVEDESFDYVHSSHCIEHMVDVRIALKNWFRVVKKEGYLLLLLPHRELYEKRKTLPSKWNPDHKHMFLIGKRELPDTLDIIEEIREGLETGYQIIYAKECSEGWSIPDPNTHSNGEYSIEIVIKKL